jgi:predicted enzyme related to lactoylglutathione lyase
MANVINWFEIPASDFERAEAFYNRIFQIKLIGSEMGKLMMGIFPLEEGITNGAIIKGKGIEPSDKGTMVYFNGGEDLNQVLERVEPAGGKVLKNKTFVNEDSGYFAIFRDTESNKVALHSMK